MDVLPTEVRLLASYLTSTREDSTYYEIRRARDIIWQDEALRNLSQSGQREDIDWTSSTLCDSYELHIGRPKDWRQIPRLVKALQGGGECGELFRTKDWSQTGLGPIHTWPAELVSLISQVLSCNLPRCAFWSHEFLYIYNDAYIDFTRGNHPDILGRSIKLARSDIWPQLEAPFERVWQGGTFQIEDQLFVHTHKGGRLLEEYATWALTHIRNSKGDMCALYVPLEDRTPKRLRERRERMLIELSQGSRLISKAEQLTDVFVNIIKDKVEDIAFSILFERDVDFPWRIRGQSGTFSTEGLHADFWLSTRHEGAIEQGNIEHWLAPLPAGFALHDLREHGFPAAQPVDLAIVLRYGNNSIIVIGVPPTCKSVEEHTTFVLDLLRVHGIFRSQAEYQELELKKAQDELSVINERALRREAQEYQKRGDAFIDMVCHEIRNPINSILHTAVYICDILETPLPEYEAENTQIREARRADIIDNVKTIIQCATHQTRIANDVLEASKIDMDRLQLISIPMQPRVVIENLLSQYKVELQDLQIATKLVTSDRAQAMSLDWTYGDPQRLLQILINLLSNAIKFTKLSDEKSIEIHLDAEDMVDEDGIWLTFSVHDSGIGLTPDEQNLLFQRFSQASSKTFNNYGGSGLGLYISKRLVEMQRGRISIFSDRAIEAGTRMSFTIASKLSPPPIQRTHSSTSSTVSLRALRVLVLEDNPINRKVLHRIVTGLGHECITGVDGREGLSLLSPTIDIILCDVDMPHMNGLEFTKKVRVEGFSRPIIAVTGNVREAQVALAIEAGMNGHIAKPYSRDDIADVLRRYCRRPSVVSTVDTLVTRMKLVNHV